MNEHSEFAFLGEEFLTWLWYRAETGEGTYRMRDGNDVGITLSDHLTLDGHEDQTEATLRHGLPTRAVEATVGLQAGKRVTKARLVVATGKQEWTLTLDGARFSFGTVKATETDADVAPDAQDYERMQAFVRIGEMIDEVYRTFLRERLRSTFVEEVVPRMRAWVAARAR